MKTRTPSKQRRTISTVLWSVAALSVGVPAVALLGGGQVPQGYIGAYDPDWFEGEPCLDPNQSVGITREFGAVQYAINVDLIGADADDETYLKCELVAGLNEMDCNAGVGDGTYVACTDQGGPHQIPRPGDIVYLLFQEEEPEICDIVIATGDRYGIADPKCRTPSGDGDGDGGSPAACNASTAQAALTTGQQTTIASNACVRLINETSWGTVDPNLQAQPGTAQYPVPFTYSSCAGTGSGSLTGNWSTTYLFDGQGAQTNPSCDVYVQLGGDGSQVQFVYYE